MVDALKAEGFNVSRSGVYHVLKKWKRDRLIFDYPRSGWPKVLDSTMHDKISRWLTENNEFTINDILSMLCAEGVNVSRSSVGRALS